jgi:hypothetical protein
MPHDPLYESYVKMCKKKGIEPLGYREWKGPIPFSGLAFIEKNIDKGDKEVTYQEAAKVLGYKTASPVSRAIACGYVKKDENGGVTEESVHAYKKELDRKRAAKVVSAKGMTQEEFEALADEDVICMSKKTLIETVRWKEAEAAEKARQEVMQSMPTVDTSVLVDLL